MRIALVISSLGCGGAERVMAGMANWWACRGRRVVLVTLADSRGDFYALEPEVERVGLGLLGDSHTAVHGALRNLVRIRALRRVFRSFRPDVVVSFMERTSVLSVLAARPLGIPVVVSERTDCVSRPVGTIWGLARRLAYRRASAFVAQSARIRDWAVRLAPGLRAAVIPNPVAPCKGGGDPEVRLPEGRIIAGLGRLETIKGFDLLLRGFAKVPLSIRDGWSVVIAGQGSERQRLETLACDLGLYGSVHLVGRVRYPERILQRADIFALPSRAEGFPNALLEAMSCGVPPVAFACPGGVSEIVRDGEDGLLVRPGEIDSFAEALARMMADERLRTRLGTRAREVADRYSERKVMEAWDGLIRTVAAK